MHLRLVGSVALHGWRQRYPQSLISCTPYAFIGFCVGLCDPAVGNSLPHVLDLMDAVRHGLLCMWMVGLGLSAFGSFRTSRVPYDVVVLGLAGLDISA